MKAILEFSMPEDKLDFDLAANANKMHAALNELDNYLRSKIKYESEGMSQEKFDTYEEIRSFLRDLTSDLGVEY